MNHRRLLPILLVLSGLHTFESLEACPYSIRDAAFQDRSSSPYQLLMLVRRDTEHRDELETWFEEAADAWLRSTNVNGAFVDLDAASFHSAARSLPSDFPLPTELPALVMVEPGKRAIDLKAFRAGETPTLDGVMDAVAQAVETPIRLEIRAALVRHWCVVVLAIGADEAANERARQAVEAAAATMTGITTELGKEIAHGPRIVEIDRTKPRDRLVIWSLRLDEPKDSQAPRAVMLTGRGEQRGDRLDGAEITKDELSEMFTMLGRSCSCTTSPVWMTGPALPLEWNAALQAEVVDSLGFDPNDPEVMRSVAAATGQEPSILDDPGLAYKEISIDDLLAESDLAPESSAPELANEAASDVPVEQTSVEEADVAEVAEVAEAEPTDPAESASEVEPPLAEVSMPESGSAIGRPMVITLGLGVVLVAVGVMVVLARRP